MNSVYIYHHLGVGDHIVANGLVRTVAKNYDKVYLFCKPHNFKNVPSMYRDLNKLEIIQMYDNEVKKFIDLNPSYNYLIVGHNMFEFILNYPGNTLYIDEIFYKMARVPFENKWKEFFVKRDIEKEKVVFDKYDIKENEEFAFIHDTEERKAIVNIPNMRIIKPTMDFLIFDFIYTIEKAKEIHCVNSSFLHLIDILGINKEKMYVHEYAIPNARKEYLGSLRSNWTILK
jgi:hypothetical protein